MNVEILHEKSGVFEERKIKCDLSRVLSDAAVKARWCLIMLCVKDKLQLKKVRKCFLKKNIYIQFAQKLYFKNWLLLK